MEVLHPTALLAEPNKCILCDETPHPNEQRVIDSGYTMVAPFSDNVWHKYICERCGLEIANRLGYVSNVQAKEAFHAAEAATERLAAVREKILVAATEIHEFASDVTLGNERSRVGKTVEGDFIETPVVQKKTPGKGGSSTARRVSATSS